MDSILGCYYECFSVLLFVPLKRLMILYELIILIGIRQLIFPDYLNNIFKECTVLALGIG